MKFSKYVSKHNAHFFLIGTKADLDDERVIFEIQWQAKTSEIDAKYIETYAKTGAKINILFNQLAIECLNIMN